MRNSGSLDGRLVSAAPWFLALAAAIFFWRLFTPGLLSYDSVDQYDQAVTGRYNDQHPPIMAVSLALVRTLGGDLPHLMLIQCVAVVLGTFCLARQCAALVLSGPRASSQASWVALGVLAILLTPISPLAVYAMTWWKDVWLMACLLWAGALAIDLYGHPVGRPTWALAGKVFAYCAAAVLAVIVRYNAIVVLPSLCLILALLLHRVVRWRFALTITLLLPLAAYGVERTIYRVFHVQCVSAERWPIGFELSEICIRYPYTARALPYTGSCITGPPSAEYMPASIFGMPVAAHLFDDVEKLKTDYQVAWRRFPREVLAVKWINFRLHFSDNPCYKFVGANYQEPMRGHQYNLALNARWSRWRTPWIHAIAYTFNDPWLRWAFVRHLPWFLLNLFAMLGAGVVWAVGRRPAAAWAALLLSLPLGYYLSYFLASLGADFRYMYPATLAMQAAALALLVAGALRVART